MKKFISVSVFLFLAISMSIPAIAQKLGRSVRTENTTVKTGIVFENQQAFSDGNGVLINWQTSFEQKNLGFLVYRLQDGETKMITNTIVGGSYLKSGMEFSTGDKYEFYDPTGDLSSVYYVQSIDANGKMLNSETIYPRQVSNLTMVGGRSADFYLNRMEQATPVIETKELNLPKDIKTVFQANDSLTDINTHRMIVAMPGVKILVKSEGFYRVSRTALENAGFNVNSDPTTWKLYLQGIEQSIIVGENGTYIEFYGKGVDVTENDKQVYYLISGGNAGKRIGTTVLRPLGNVVGTSYNQTYVRKDRENYAGNLLNGDTENFFGTAVLNVLTSTINFNLDGVDFNSPKCSFDLNIQGLTSTIHNINVTLNGEVLDPLTGVGPFMMNGKYRIPTQYFREGANTLQLRSTVGTSMVESIKVNFNRLYLAQNNKLSFYTNPYKSNTLTGFSTANVRVFDINFPDTPSLITGLPVSQNNGSFEVRLPAHRGRAMYAVEDSALMQPASIVQNVPSMLATAAHHADLVIISHKDFLGVAENWATYRRGQGFTAEVVDIADIFDEFNFGANSSLSIRDFLQYAKNNWQTPPKYVLMIGDSSYDPRNYLGYGELNFIPTKLVDTIYTETGSDETLADFNDDGLAEIPIGRISVRTAAEATTILNKVIQFEQNSNQGFDRGFLFAYDLPNGYDFQGVSQRLAALLPANVTKTFVGREMTNAQSLLLNDMNTGRFVINYAGHGNAKDWVNSSFFGYSVVPQMNNANNLSIFTLLTCLNGYFVDPNPTRESLGEYLVKYPNGGSVATWASTGLTTPDIQEVMATRFYTKLTEGQIIRLGDLVKDAKSVIIGGRDVRLSWSLLGDPMLKVR